MKTTILFLLPALMWADEAKPTKPEPLPAEWYIRWGRLVEAENRIIEEAASACSARGQQLTKDAQGIFWCAPKPEKEPAR